MTRVYAVSKLQFLGSFGYLIKKLMYMQGYIVLNQQCLILVAMFVFDCLT